MQHGHPSSDNPKDLNPDSPLLHNLLPDNLPSFPDDYLSNDYLSSDNLVGTACGVRLQLILERRLFRLSGLTSHRLRPTPPQFKAPATLHTTSQLQPL